jgi:hypothetical protein
MQRFNEIFPDLVFHFKIDKDYLIEKSKSSNPEVLEEFPHLGEENIERRFTEYE